MVFRSLLIKPSEPLIDREEKQLFWLTIRQASRNAGLRQTCAKGGTGRDGYDHLEGIKISASHRSSYWSLCRGRMRRLERLHPFVVRYVGISADDGTSEGRTGKP